MKWPVIILAGIMVAACSNDQDGINSWMEQQAAGMKRGIEPLPELQTFPVVDYEMASAMDPFNLAKLEPEKRPSGGNGPDPNRRREPLEAYPLESLKMVGYMVKERGAHAIVKADKNLYQVHVGNYVGQNFGVITNIRETEVTLKELVEDLNGDWTERTSALQLQEQEGK
jgi:type IV pilus assembly protein PilP